MTDGELLQRIADAAREQATKLDLSNNQLTALPPEIGQLTQLTELDLHDNQLTALPSEIGQLTQLTHLNLRSNQLTALPPEIAQLTQLTSLRLSHNPLTALSPQIAQLTQLTLLQLVDNQLTALPPEIGQLTQLTQLDLGGNQLTALPPEIAQLNQLTRLDLSYNRSATLPPQIAQLTQLTRLDLSGNQLTALPPEIGQLTQLTQLNLRSNQLTALLLPEIAQLTQLNYLHLSRNQLTALPPELFQLTQLTWLSLCGNQLTALPPEISQLTNLKTLILGNRLFGGNQLTALPPEITQLTQLTRLNLSYNKLTALPPEIAQLTQLTRFDLSHNQLTTLPPEIGQLTQLTELQLGNNQLTALPAEIGQLTQLTELDLPDNPLPIPPEILEKRHDPAAIITYYLEHEAGRKRPLNEAKVILVGQGSVGKTSLVKRLVDDTFDPHERKTEGIDIQRWQTAVDDHDVRLNVWDFGGQEIMHATHQFFLTRRSLYLLVLDARLAEDENRVEYWLKMIQSFGGDSPIIVVGNKVDQQRLDIDRRGLQAKYPSVKAFVETSCQTREGIDDLHVLIAREVGALDHVHDELLLSWFAIKDRLEEMEEDYILYPDYVQLCQTGGVTDGRSQRTLIGFLHDLGIVLNFQDDPRLEDTNILNPEWVTNGVYRILNSNALFQAKGVLDRSMLNRILDSREYPRDKHLFIVDMMRKFELCFDFEGFPDRRFLVPDLLSKEEPYTGEWGGALAFQYHYNVLPGSIISRFIVRMNAYIHQNTYWRSGVVLAHDGNRALVKADREDKKIFVWVTGPDRTRRTFLAIIRSQFDAIHTTISRIEAVEKVPLPAHPEIVVDYDHLLTLERIGEATFIPEGLAERVSVKQLLDGVEPEQQRQERHEGQLVPTRPDTPAAPSPQPQQPAPTPTRPKISPWISNLFLFVALAAIMTLIAAIATKVPWYVLPIVVVGGLLAITIIGAFDLLRTEALSEASFLTLMAEALKQLPLLRRLHTPKKPPARRQIPPPR